MVHLCLCAIQPEEKQIPTIQPRALCHSATCFSSPHDWMGFPNQRSSRRRRRPLHRRRPLPSLAADPPELLLSNPATADPQPHPHRRPPTLHLHGWMPWMGVTAPSPTHPWTDGWGWGWGWGDEGAGSAPTPPAAAAAPWTLAGRNGRDRPPSLLSVWCPRHTTACCCCCGGRQRRRACTITDGLQDLDIYSPRSNLFRLRPTTTTTTATGEGYDVLDGRGGGQRAGV